MVVIGLLGNPFSPGYARARDSEGRADPLRFSSLNVAIRGRKGSLWSLRERALSPSDRRKNELSFGASEVRWNGDRLEITVEERSTPFLGIGPRRVAGKIVFRPEGLTSLALPLDSAGAHTWWPVAPRGRIEVDLHEPGVRFSGAGYHDANAGDGALERTFSDWHWCRGRTRKGHAIVTYDARSLDGTRTTHGLDWNGSEVAGLTRAARVHTLPTSLWGIGREAPCDPGSRPTLASVLEDTPFYARSLVDTELSGERVRVVHESLDARRLARAWVRGLLGFKMGKG